MSMCSGRIVYVLIVIVWTTVISTHCEQDEAEWDIPGYRLTQKPYTAVVPPKRMKRWIECDVDVGYELEEYDGDEAGDGMGEAELGEQPVAPIAVDESSDNGTMPQLDGRNMGEHELDRERGSVCGPLKVTPSEHEACYDSESGAEIPCPDKSQPGTGILKRCRPPYAMDIMEEPILNVTYQCKDKIWQPEFNTCQPVCGPLKVTPSEHEACYDSESGAEIPCPDKSQPGTGILKRCRPPYAMDIMEEPIMNVTYQCKDKIWQPEFNACQPVCGPLKVTPTEHEACYDSESGAEIPCPDESQPGTGILKRCRSPYAMDITEEPILNVTYQCKGKIWHPEFSACQPDCGRPTANNKYPWIAAIYDVNGGLNCTGTIISAYHVLTAAACFLENYKTKKGSIYGNTQFVNDTSNLVIVAGKHYRDIHKKKESAQIRKIKKATNRPILIYFARHDLVVLEVDKEFEFFDHVQPVCVDWNTLYDERDYTEGNEAVVVDWAYNRDEVVPCEDTNEFNIQYWHTSTCLENVAKEVANGTFDYQYCGTYLNGTRSNCGQSMGTGIFFKSSPWRYYIRGVTVLTVQEPGVTHIFYTDVTPILRWLYEELHTNKLLSKRESFFKTRDNFFSEKTTGCILPEDIKYGTFKLSFGDTYRPGTWVSTGTRILSICTVYGIDTPSSTRCNLGHWQPPLDALKCKRPGTCPALLPSESRDIFCRYKGQEISCAEPLTNTTAIVRCKPFYGISGNKPIYRCKDGVWDQQLASCILECGIKRVGVSTLVVGGSEVIKNEFPWAVAVYRLTEQICSGTIISKSYVVSAAHCFTISNGTAQDKEMFTIFAGKHYRDINAEEPSAQRRKIKSLHIHDDYKGNLQKHRDDIALIEVDAEFIPSLDVQPVCLDWDNLYEEFDFSDGNKAVVVGWGYTKQGGPPSDVLKKLVLSYRPEEVCMANLPKEFSYQYLATDKICAGDKDSNMNVCQGDSGGGLYFKSDDKRYYVRGIVSLTAKTETGTCYLNKFSLYTKVSKYLLWIETITRRVL